MSTAFEKKLQFLNPGDRISDPIQAHAVILPVPLEKTTSYMKGTALGPQAIVEASTQVELFDSELEKEICEIGIHTDWEIGNPAVLNEQPMEKILDQIRVKVHKLLGAGKFVLALGGEHTITVGLIDPYLERWKDELTVVHLDGHADLKDTYENTPYSHACALRRVWDKGVPIVSAGIRSVDPEEYELGKSSDRISLFYAHEIRKNPKWIEAFIEKIQTPYVYLTIDVDGFDPSVIPSVGTPEPGGLFWNETLELIRTVAKKHKIVGADVNELCPGPFKYADFATAKLCYKIIGYCLL